MMRLAFCVGVGFGSVMSGSRRDSSRHSSGLSCACRISCVSKTSFRTNLRVRDGGRLLSADCRCLSAEGTSRMGENLVVKGNSTQLCIGLIMCSTLRERRTQTVQRKNYRTKSSK